MPTVYNTDYLKFDAITIRDKVIQKLSENQHFTDQVFADSNLRILIEDFSYLFEVLMFYLNHSASESIFTDSQLYENLNRIVKMLGYNPYGYNSSKTDVTFIGKTDPLFASASKILPKYTYISTALTDTRGKSIFFSTIDNTFIQSSMPSTNTDKVTVVNGRWRVYNQTFAAAGVPFEEFTMNQIDITSTTNPIYIAHPYIDVYVKRKDSNNQDIYMYYKAISDGTLFGKGVSLVGPDEDVFELRLNENKQYVLKFGDGIHGSKLQARDELYIVYLESNGPDGKIGAGVINSDSVIQWGITGIDQSLFLQFIGVTDISELVGGSDATELTNLYAENSTASTIPNDIESVESIRTNAPNWFRMGGRLVTAKDFKDYMNSTYVNDIYDCNVQNNWEYMTTFQDWLYKYSKLAVDIRKDNYIYADSCDFNNIYIWCKFKYNINSAFIERDLLPKKVLTGEPIILDSINTYFIPCYVLDSSYSIDSFDPNIENWIEILKDKNNYVSAEKIKKLAIDTIRNFFDPEKVHMGDNLNINELYNRLNAIDGVKSISTVYKKSNDANFNAQYFNGLSFAIWSKQCINGADLNTYSGNIQLQPFQFPVLIDTDLENRVKVVFETFGQPSIEY
jgi:hypothetical protein